MGGRVSFVPAVFETFLLYQQISIYRMNVQLSSRCNAMWYMYNISIVYVFIYIYICVCLHIVTQTYVYVIYLCKYTYSSRKPPPKVGQHLFFFLAVSTIVSSWYLCSSHITRGLMLWIVPGGTCAFNMQLNQVPGSVTQILQSHSHPSTESYHPGFLNSLPIKYWITSRRKHKA